MCHVSKHILYQCHISCHTTERIICHHISGEEDDSPPIADGGPDRVVQPQETVTLNGIQSKDDKGIAKYQWRVISGHPSAVMEVSAFSEMTLLSP